MTLHITNAYHATSGGVSTFYRSLLAYANAHGREIRLIVPAEHPSIERVGNHALIYHVPARNSPVADTRYRILWPWGTTGRRIRQILREEQPDLVEISDKYTLPLLAGFIRKSWISGMRDRPSLIATSHERMDDTSKAYFGMPRIWDVITPIFMRKYYFPMFDLHIANSRYTADELIPASKGHRLHREIRILPMGVDADKLNPASRTPGAREAFAQRSNAPLEANLLLYAGRLATEKNLPLLIATIDQLPKNFHLIVAGAGPLEPWLRGQSNRRIHCIGHTPRADMDALYAGADAFVHANAREPFGIAPLEAMAAGLPLVAPNSGGVLSYATEQNAWLAEPTPQAFAKTVTTLFENRQEATLRAARAREVAVKHDWPAVAARYFTLFDECIAQKDRWR